MGFKIALFFFHRDLLKWVERSAVHFKGNEYATDTGYDVMMCAIDCFVASCSDVSTRLQMIENICVELNISKEKVGGNYKQAQL